MKAYRLGSLAFVIKDGELLVKIELENFEAARKAVSDFNAGKHDKLGYN